MVKSICFTGCGFLTPYLIGSALALKKFSVSFQEAEVISGSSSGSLVALLCMIDVENWGIDFN